MSAKTNLNSRPLFVLLLMLLTPFLMMSRNNPVMVINCFQDNTLQQPIAVTPFPCINNACPPGTVIDQNANNCECIPDCSTVVPYNNNDCSICDNNGGVSWSTLNNSCGCDDTPNYFACGCPPWFEPVVDISIGFTGCEIADTPCFDGDVVWSSEGECDQPDMDGLVTTTVTIQLPIFGDGSQMPGYAVTLDALENCELTSGENFVLELADEYGSDVAFVDDDNDGEIVVIFRRNPALPTLIDFQNDNQDIELPSCNPIPTLGFWASLILGFLIIIIGILAVGKKPVFY